MSTNLSANQSDDTFCNVSARDRSILLLSGANGTVSTVVCLISAFLLLFFRMWKTRTNRILLSFSLATSLISVSIMIQLIGVQVNYWNGEHHSLCSFKGFVQQYSVWVMLLSTLMVTFHLCGMACSCFWCYKSLSNKYLEIFYHIFPWTFPILIALIPLATDSYGVSGPWCWIKVFNDNCSLNLASVGLIYGLWYGEVTLLLIFNTTALLYVFVTLCKHYCQKDEQTNQYRKAFAQTLPLIAFSVIFQLYTFIALANRVIQTALKGHYIQWSFYLHGVAAPAWGFFGGFVIIIYIIATGKFRKKNVIEVSREWWLTLKCKKEIDTETKSLLGDDHFTKYIDGATIITKYDPISESEVDNEYEEVV